MICVCVGDQQIWQSCRIIMCSYQSGRQYAIIHYDHKSLRVAIACYQQMLSWCVVVTHSLRICIIFIYYQHSLSSYTIAIKYHQILPSCSHRLIASHVPIIYFQEFRGTLGRQGGSPENPAPGRFWGAPWGTRVECQEFQGTLATRCPGAPIILWRLRRCTGTMPGGVNPPNRSSSTQGGGRVRPELAHECSGGLPPPVPRTPRLTVCPRFYISRNYLRSQSLKNSMARHSTPVCREFWCAPCWHSPLARWSTFWKCQGGLKSI